MKRKKKKNLAFFEEFPKEGDIVEGVVLEKRGKAIWVDLGIALGVIFGREYLLAKNNLKKINLGDKIKAKVINVEGEGGAIELSLKDLKEEMKWEKLKEIKEKDEVVEGKIVGVNNGGLLVKVNDVKGFLPISHFSEERLQALKESNPSSKDLVKSLQKFLGKPIKVKILNLSLRTHRLVFSEKQALSL